MLTAFIVCSGNRGRADVLHKSGLRLAGALGGTAAATLLAGGIPAGSAVTVAAIFAVLGVAVLLRTLSYAYWAAGITAVLALLNGYFGVSGSGVLGERLAGILAGAAIGVAVSWLVLPVRTTDVLRRRARACPRRAQRRARRPRPRGRGPPRSPRPSWRSSRSLHLCGWSAARRRSTRCTPARTRWRRSPPPHPSAARTGTRRARATRARGRRAAARRTPSRRRTRRLAGAGRRARCRAAGVGRRAGSDGLAPEVVVRGVRDLLLGARGGRGAGRRRRGDAAARVDALDERRRRQAVAELARRSGSWPRAAATGSTSGRRWPA